MAAIKVKQLNKEMAEAKIIGLNLSMADQIKANAAAINAKRKNLTPVVKVQDGIDFEKLGGEAADATLELNQEVKAERDALNTYANLSRGELWLYFAQQVSTEEQASILAKSFKAQMEARGHKRAASDASDFKTFVIATLKSPDEVLGAMASSPDYHQVMKELRQIKNDGQTKARGNNGTPRSLSDAGFAKVQASVARMTAKQLTQLFKAGQARAKVLRKAGDFIEAFTA